MPENIEQYRLLAAEIIRVACVDLLRAYRDYSNRPTAYNRHRVDIGEEWFRSVAFGCLNVFEFTGDEIIHALQKRAMGGDYGTERHNQYTHRRKPQKEGENGI